MPAAKALPQFEAFGAYVDPFCASQKAVTFWTEYWRAALGTAVWWSEQWLATMASLVPAAAPADMAESAGPRPVADIIHLAQAAAARTAADIGDVASEVVEIAETAAEIPTAMAEEAVAVAETATEELAPVDDLTRLVGIGPKLAAALAERGVTRFGQIAAWTDKDLAEVDKALDLKGRAVRDAWVAQARRLTSES